MCQRFKFASAAVRSHIKKRVMSFLGGCYLYFPFPFSFLMAVCTVLSPFRFDWEHVETEGTFLYRPFSQQTFELAIAGKAQEQLITLMMV